MASRMKLMKLLTQGKNPKRQMNRPSVREAAKKTKWNILRGDTVQVIQRGHPEYGKQGIVERVDRKKDRVVVQGLNQYYKNLKAQPNIGLPGKQILKERSMHYSNVNLVDPVTGLPTRVTRKYLEDGTKVRVAKRSGAIIPRPEILSERRKPKKMNATESDTPAEYVWEITYVDPSSAN